MIEDSTRNTIGETRSKTTGPPALSLDWEAFGEHLEASDLTDDQKREFIEVLWSLVVNFVDLGFGIHPLQLVMENSCEQQAEIAKFIASDSSPVLSSEDRSTSEFNAAAKAHSCAARERSAQ
tara:strand:- start:5800 stop:6165 length:366 start_codon:yes stop_codon:yes gene_type:complete